MLRNERTHEVRGRNKSLCQLFLQYSLHGLVLVIMVSMSQVSMQVEQGYGRFFDSMATDQVCVVLWILTCTRSSGLSGNYDFVTIRFNTENHTQWVLSKFTVKFSPQKIHFPLWKFYNIYTLIYIVHTAYFGAWYEKLTTAAWNG